MVNLISILGILANICLFIADHRLWPLNLLAIGCFVVAMVSGGMIR